MIMVIYIRETTEERRLTPETHMNCVIRFPAKTRKEDVADPFERLEKPCLMSGTRNKKMGRERKC